MFIMEPKVIKSVCSKQENKKTMSGTKQNGI
jgi:hypothetical protein